MREALWLWAQFPRQIADDLRARGLHIKHWLRGTRGPDGDLILSSYELTELLEFLPDESAFKTQAERGGQWSIAQQIAAESVNEQYRFRASYHMVNGGEEASFDPTEFLFIDPALQAIRDAADSADQLAAAAAQDHFNAAIGFSSRKEG